MQRIPPRSKRCRGLYRKFVVIRIDGKSEPGKRHAECEYFVLDFNHDPFAMPAIRAYADACQKKYPILSAELRQKAIEMVANEDNQDYGHIRSTRWKLDQAKKKRRA